MQVEGASQVPAMDSLTATFRLLHSSDASLERKIEAAESLLSALLDGSAAAEGVQEPPLLVRAHYLRSVLEWCCGVLTKNDKDAAATGAAAGKEGKKSKKKPQPQEQEQEQQQVGAAGGAHGSAKLQPRCWAVLTAVLGSSSTSASQALPASLLPAATAALQMVQSAGQLGQQQALELLSQLSQLLLHLSGKFASSIRAGIEPAAAAAEAALSGHAVAAAAAGAAGASPSTAALQQGWQDVAAAAVQLLLGAAGSHPNQRKVWDACMPRLLPLLAQGAFPAGSNSCTGSSSSSLLFSLCQQLLDALLFNQQHVAALAEAAAAEMAAALSEAQSPAANGCEAGADTAEVAAHKHRDGKKQAEGQAQHGASYAAHLFAVLQQQVAAGQLPLPLLPWLSGRFCAALRQHLRTVEAEAAVAGGAGRRSQQAAGLEGGADAAANAREGLAGSGSGNGGVGVSADFHFWLALLRSLLPQAERLQQQQQQAQAAGDAEAAAAAGAQLATVVSGMAQLAAALRRHQVYRPTQDPGGRQRLLLQRLADAALLLAQQQQKQQQQQHGRVAAAAAAEVLPAALGVLQGILAVEHRVIQQQLPLLWPLLLQPSAASALPAGSSSSSTVSSMPVALAVACSLVEAFAELRQMPLLLESLTAALLQAGQQQQQQQQAGGNPALAAAAAAVVLHSGEFRAALAEAVQQLPSGLVPTILRLAAAAVAQLGSSSSSSSGAGGELVADLHCHCLASLRIDLTTAAAAAAATGELVAALAPLLLPLLQGPAAGPTSGGSAKKERKRKQWQGDSQDGPDAQGGQAAGVLPALLLLYRQVLLVHAHCAALHPQVAPLPGQQVRQASLTPHQPGSAPLPSGYFAPLAQLNPAGDVAAAADGAAPQLVQLLLLAGDSSNGSSSSGGGSRLKMALLHAAEQRLGVLHQQLQYLRHTCPITLLPAEAEGQQVGQDTEQQQQPEQPVQKRQQQEEQVAAVEAELRQLATFMAATAAEEAAAGSTSSSSSRWGCVECVQLVAGALPLLQEWAAEAQLQQLVQACLRQSTAAAGGRGGAGSAEQRVVSQLCRRLVLGGELLELGRLAAMLPAAAAAELGAALSSAVGGISSTGAEGVTEQPKKRKKSKAAEGGSAEEPRHSSGSNSTSCAAELLQQLGRLAKGKGLKSSSWEAAVEGSCSAIAALATQLTSLSSGGGSGGKKRRQQHTGGEQHQPAGGGATEASLVALQAVQQQAALLAQLPLGHLPPGPAAGMAAVAMGSTLCCCLVGLQLQLLQADGAGQQPAGGSALAAVASSQALLSRVAQQQPGSSSNPGSSGLDSQQALLPGLLLAALQAAASIAGNGSAWVQQQLAAVVQHGGSVMQAVCSAQLAALDASGLQQLAKQLTLQPAVSAEQQWATAVLAEACLAACCAATHSSSSSSGGGGSSRADILCGAGATNLQHLDSPIGAALLGGLALALEPGVAAALPAASAAGLAGYSWQQAQLASSLYRSSALLLRLHCCDHAAADWLEQQQQQQQQRGGQQLGAKGGSGNSASSGGSSAVLSSMAASLQAAAALLSHPAAAPEGTAGGSSTSLSQAVLEYVAACCHVTGRMRPAASNSHVSSLLALLLHLLSQQQQQRHLGYIPPSRHIIPFASAFPAAAVAAAGMGVAGEAAVAAAQACSTGAASLRPLVLEALRELVAGSSSQQLLLPLRFVEAALPAAATAPSAVARAEAAPAAASTATCTCMALPLCELLLVLLEASSGSRQHRLLGQHGDRIAALLTSFIGSIAYRTGAAESQQGCQQPPSLQQLAAAILAAGEGNNSSSSGGGSGTAAPLAAAVAGSAPPASRAAELAALCTALRALESLAARPKLFPLSPAAASSMLACIAAVWNSYAEPQPGSWAAAATTGAAESAVVPGFRFRLDTSSGAGLCAGCCHLLLAMLRHRQQELRRCLPLVLQAVRALLRFLAAAELSCKLVQHLHLPHSSTPAPTASGSGSESQQQRLGREQQWRIKCAELLASVMEELAGLKEAGVGRYCPQLLADYLLLAAAPPSGRSKALLHYSTPAHTPAPAAGFDASKPSAMPAAASASAVSLAAGAVAAAGAAAEEDLMAGEPLSASTSAALRRGAHALYGACSAAEIQFLYASLGSAASSGGQRGSGAAASWRTALAALKADYERSFKYSGKV